MSDVVASAAIPPAPVAFAAIPPAPPREPPAPQAPPEPIASTEPTPPAVGPVVASAPIPPAHPIELMPPPAPGARTDRIGALLGAGFSRDEIGAWSTERRAMLGAVGFDDQEIDDYLGNKPRLSPAFFDRMVRGAQLRPETKPDMLGELYRGAVRAGASLVYSVEDLANRIERKAGELTGYEAIKSLAAQDTAELVLRKDQLAQDYAPGTGTLDEIGGPRDAAHYVLGKIGETAPAIAEFLVLGVPRMVILGALGGALKAADDTNGDAGAVATGAAIGGAAAGAPVPFLNGSVGKGMLDTVAKSALGMATVGAVQSFADPLPKAVAGQGYTPPTLADVAEGAASGAIGGAVFGVAGSLGRHDRPAAGEAHDRPIGGLPKAEEFHTAAQVVAGEPAPPPHATQKLEQLYEEHGIHPAEVAHDAARDVTISQDLLSTTPKLPEAYAPPAGKAAPPEIAATAPLEGGIAGDTAHQAAEDFRIPKPGSPPVGMGIAPTGPPRTPDEQAILSRLSIGEKDATRDWSWRRFYTAVLDRLDPINQAVKEAVGNVRASVDAYKLARLYAGVSGKADHFLNYGTFDFATHTNNGKSLKDIIEPVLGDLNGFRAFATSLHALEWERQGLKTGMDMAAARSVAAAGQAKYAPVMAELVQYQDRALQYLVDAGVVSQAAAAGMRAKYTFYVPFQRVFGDVVGDIMPDAIRGPVGKSLQASNPIHGAEGSERRVIDPLESTIRNTYLAMAMAERNRVGTTLVDALGKSARSPQGAVDTISIYRNGTKETHEVDRDLAAAMKGLDEESVNTMLRILGMPANLLRAGATLTPDFMVRNLMRDFTSAFINTGKGVFSPLDSARGLMAALSKNEAYQDWLKSGGAHATMVGLDRRYLQEDLAKLTADTGLGTRAWNVIDPRNWIDNLRTVSELAEQTTRLGEFIGVRKNELAAGASPKEAAETAAYSSREVSLDFARRGSSMRAMNMITAFFNPQLQGVDRIARQFRDNPIGTATKIFAGITLPSVLLWMENHDDPRWKEIPGWQRDLFWLVMTKDTVYRIPKPFEIGVLFGSSVERALDLFAEQKPEAFRSFAKSVMDALLPSVIPTVALPFAEHWANRSSLTDRTLIPSNLEKGLPEYQYTPYTTELAKALGQAFGAFPGMREASLGDTPVVSGVARALTSPILLENYLRAWTGGLGVYALQATDAALRANGILPDPPKPASTLADTPFIKAFVIRYPTASAESIQRFYDDYNKNEKYLESFRQAKKDGNVQALKDIPQMNPTMFSELKTIKKTLDDQSQLVRNITKNPMMPPDEKRQLIDTTYMNMISIARRGVQVQQRISATIH